MADEKAADKLMKQAEKSLRPSVMSMRLKPDWNDALPLFEKAALQYRVVGANQKALDAYEKAAEANLRGHGTEWHAAKHLESAAQISKDMERWSATADFARRASQLYVDAGKLGTGAECMGRAARWLETGSPATSGALYKEAVELYAQDPVASLAYDIVQRGVELLLKAQKWDDAAAMLMQWASVCLAQKSHPHLCRAYLGVIVIFLYSGQYEAAWASYQDFLDVEPFSNSAEAMSAENLFDGYCSGDAATIKQRLGQGRCWQNLDAGLARRAKELPSELGDLQAMAKFFSRHMHDGEGGAADAPEDDDGELDLT